MSRTKRKIPDYSIRRWFGGGPSHPDIKRMWNRIWRRRLNRELLKEEPQLVQHRHEGLWKWW